MELLRDRYQSQEVTSLRGRGKQWRRCPRIGAADVLLTPSWTFHFVYTHALTHAQSGARRWINHFRQHARKKRWSLVNASTNLPSRMTAHSSAACFGWRVGTTTDANSSLKRLAPSSFNKREHIAGPDIPFIYKHGTAHPILCICNSVIKTTECLSANFSITYLLPKSIFEMSYVYNKTILAAIDHFFKSKYEG